MSDDKAPEFIPTAGWAKVASRFIETQAVGVIGWIFSGAVLWQLSVIAPALVERGITEMKSQAQAFADNLEKVARNNLEAAKSREAATEMVLAEFRRDEAEDRRLFVELLRRAELTPESIEEAVRAATQPERPPPP